MNTNGFSGSLDPYTQFENNVEAQEMNVKALGRYGGVGLVIAKDVRDKNQIIVVSSFERYAFDAGLRPGDRLLVVDGHPGMFQDAFVIIGFFI
jgi:C-terminal processing protease CtpA/Prc